MTTPVRSCSRCLQHALALLVQGATPRCSIPQLQLLEGCSGACQVDPSGSYFGWKACGQDMLCHLES
eukprot:5133632-Amphidinium_carterae.2